MATGTAVLDYPIGTIMAYAGSVDSLAAMKDLGWLPCDGSSLSMQSSEYGALYAAIGSTYGADDTEFYLPDYRGRFLRGVDGTRGLDPDAASRTAPNPTKSVQGNQGNNVGSLQGDQMSAHTHSYTQMGGTVQIQADKWGPTSVTDPMSTWQTGATGSGDTRPKNISVLYLIKYKTTTNA